MSSFCAVSVRSSCSLESVYKRYRLVQGYEQTGQSLFFLCLEMISTNLWTTFLFIFPLASAAGSVHYANHGHRPQCTVLANGGTTNDVPNIVEAFNKCGKGGDIVFPEGQNYYIASKLNPVVDDVNINWGGIWTVSHDFVTMCSKRCHMLTRHKFSPDIDYWRQNSSTFPIAFQNHAASFILTGDHIRINGHGTGGIHGNGDTW